MFQFKSKKANSYSKTAARKNSLYRKRRGNANSRQVPDYPIQRTPIPTATAPMSEIRYEAGAARPHNCVRSSVIIDGQIEDVIEFIEKLLSNNNWRELIKRGDICCYAQNILNRWKEIFPILLEYYVFEHHGANQSCTFHRVKSTDADNPIVKGGMSKMKRLYGGSDGIRKSRVYGPDEEIKRYLRHMASALKIKFGIENEIQCYYDDNIVYVAANTQGDENKLLEIEGEGVSKYDAVLQDYSQKAYKYNKSHSEPNWAEFITEILHCDLSDKSAEVFARRFRHIIPCPQLLENATFKVITSSDINNGIPGLHAERKILYYLRSLKGNENMFLNPLRLGGIRRPCFICAALCFSSMDQVRPGPVWVSAAASTPKDISEMFLILDAIRNKKNITYITLGRNNNPTMDHDTESESGESAYDIKR